MTKMMTMVGGEEHGGNAGQLDADRLAFRRGGGGIVPLIWLCVCVRVCAYSDEICDRNKKEENRKLGREKV